MKRTVHFLLLTILFCMVGIKAGAEESGSCGDGVTWTLSGGTLTISYSGSGTGAMDDYIYDLANKQPWRSSMESIRTVVIEEGVTSIGVFALFGCISLTSASISKTVTSIGDYAFSGCSLTSVKIPNSVTNVGAFAFASSLTLKSATIGDCVTSIGDYAFSYTALTSINIPKSVTSIGYGAFSGCFSLTSVSSLIEKPMDINKETFEESIYKNITLYVPEGTTINYQACTGWQEFVNIVEGSPTGISSCMIKNNEETNYYSIDGRRNSKPHKGLNIINGKKRIVK